MKLKKLIDSISIDMVKGAKDLEITGICSDSRLVAPGNLFVARRGTQDDGSRYIPKAIEGGASAIATDLYDPSLKGITQVIAGNMRDLEANLAAEFYSHPSRELFTIGITGTNGKTTTSFIVKHLLDRLEMECGLIGTIERIVGPLHFSAALTTPDIATSQKLLREMVNRECHACVMEASSHALDQGRTATVDFDVGVFTNLSLDHLDYHETMDEYAKAKAKLFSTVKFAIVNADDPYHKQMIANRSREVITFGKQGDLSFSNVRYSLETTKFDVHYKGLTIPCEMPLIGRINIYNALAAIGVALTTGATLDQIVPLLKTTPPIRARLEPVPNAKNIPTFVDFAHTPDGLREVLLTLRELHAGRIILVFGCGGDRDRSKRSEMGVIAHELADCVIITSDNPRSEEPEAICKEIAGNLPVEVVVDRKEAIAKALSMATTQDLVLVAGKGHETTQIFAHHTVPFDDRKVIQEIANA